MANNGFDLKFDGQRTVAGIAQWIDEKLTLFLEAMIARIEKLEADYGEQAVDGFRRRLAISESDLKKVVSRVTKLESQPAAAPATELTDEQIVAVLPGFGTLKEEVAELRNHIGQTDAIVDGQSNRLSRDETEFDGRIAKLSEQLTQLEKAPAGAIDWTNLPPEALEAIHISIGPFRGVKPEELEAAVETATGPLKEQLSAIELKVATMEPGVKEPAEPEPDPEMERLKELLTKYTDPESPKDPITIASAISKSPVDNPDGWKILGELEVGTPLIEEVARILKLTDDTVKQPNKPGWKLRAVNWFVELIGLNPKDFMIQIGDQPGVNFADMFRGRKT